MSDVDPPPAAGKSPPERTGAAPQPSPRFYTRSHDHTHPSGTSIDHTHRVGVTIDHSRNYLAGVGVGRSACMQNRARRNHDQSKSKKSAAQEAAQRRMEDILLGLRDASLGACGCSGWSLCDARTSPEASPLELFSRCVGGRDASHQHCVQHFCKGQQISTWPHDSVVHGSWAVLRSRTLGYVSCACVPPVYVYGVMCGVCVGSGQHAAMGPRGDKTKCTHGRGEGFNRRSSSSFLPSLKGRSARQTASRRVAELSIRYTKPFLTSVDLTYTYGRDSARPIFFSRSARCSRIASSSRRARSTGRRSHHARPICP